MPTFDVTVGSFEIDNTRCWLQSRPTRAYFTEGAGHIYRHMHGRQTEKSTTTVGESCSKHKCAYNGSGQNAKQYADVCTRFAAGFFLF